MFSLLDLFYFDALSLPKKVTNDNWDRTWEEIERNLPNHFGIKIIIVSAVYKTEGDKDETHESLKDDELEAGKKKEYFM